MKVRNHINLDNQIINTQDMEPCTRSNEKLKIVYLGHQMNLNFGNVKQILEK